MTANVAWTLASILCYQVLLADAWTGFGGATSITALVVNKGSKSATMIQPKEVELAPGKSWRGDMGTNVGDIVELSTPKVQENLHKIIATDKFVVVLVKDADGSAEVHDDKSLKA